MTVSQLFIFIFSLSDVQASSEAEEKAALDYIRKTKHISAEDRLYISPKREDHQSTLHQIGREHKHPDEEVRLFERGTGFFDVRDPHDRWLRVRLAQGDLLILPAGIYHRFTPASLEEEITVRRLFTDESSWVADFR
ncbi:acireductone dioxygenase-like [Ornithodoros turicata]|uniref:acireductone dioxygenase-like n=1 Tax=Ornithodoros turicata TaxID=34597 RepID=UPI003139A77A